MARLSKIGREAIYAHTATDNRAIAAPADICEVTYPPQVKVATAIAHRALLSTSTGVDATALTRTTRGAYRKMAGEPGCWMTSNATPSARPEKHMARLSV